MDFGSSNVTFHSPAPRFEPDLRPVADAAASKDVTAPALPIAPPATQLSATSQIGEINRSLLLASGLEEDDAEIAITPVTSTERTLKPFGVTMLPSDGLDDTGSSVTSEPSDEPVASDYG